MAVVASLVGQCDIFLKSSVVLDFVATNPSVS